MKIEKKLDRQVLQMSIQEKIKYFERKMIAHPHLEWSHKLTLDYIENADRGEIVTIVGPTGVGTTQIGRRIWTDARCNGNSQEGFEPAIDSPYIAAIGLEAPSNSDRVDSNYINSLLITMLARLGDMLCDNKIYVPPSEFMLAYALPRPDSKRRDTCTLLKAVASMLRHRKTRIILISQAERLFPIADPKGSSRTRQMLLDLSAQTEARIILIGSYQMLLGDSQSNWKRRQNLVHFRRYDHKNEEENKHFVQALFGLLSHIPSERMLSHITEDDAHNIYMQCIGCIGTLKRTLASALNSCLRHNQELTIDHILKSAQSNAVMLQIAKEARAGEELLMDVPLSEVENALQAGLSLPDTKASSSQVSPSRSPSSSPGSWRGSRIGERKPNRDPAGGYYEQKRA